MKRATPFLPVILILNTLTTLAPNTISTGFNMNMDNCDRADTLANSTRSRRTLNAPTPTRQEHYSSIS